MDFEDISWKTFRKTGDIDAYLLHIEIETVRKNRWKQSKQEGLLQSVQTTEKPTAY